MKTFKNVIEESVRDTIVLAFGRMSPPTIGHGLLVKKVRDFALETNSTYAIFLSKTQDKKKNPLPIDRKMYWAKKMFPGAHIFPATDKIRTFIELVKSFSGKYENLVFVAGSDRVSEYQNLLNKYNGSEFKFKSIKVVSAGERDPDEEGASGMSASKMRNAAASNDSRTFRLGTGLNKSDSDKMMQEVRAGMGIKPVTESNPAISKTRNAFFLGETFREGQFVQSLADTTHAIYEILDRGTNYVTVANTGTGDISKKFIDTLLVVEAHSLPASSADGRLCFKGYLTSHAFNERSDIVEAFVKTIEKLELSEITDTVAVLKSIKAVDSIVNGMNVDKSIEVAESSLSRINEMNNHKYLEEFNEEVGNIKVSDKLRVASVIADTLGGDSSGTNAAVIVNNALRKVRSNSAMRRGESLKIISRMLELADQVGIGYDKNILKDLQVTEGVKRPARPDRFHITLPSGKPATLASYPDRASAEKDRDEKYKGAIVQQITSRGRVVEDVDESVRKWTSQLRKDHGSGVKTHEDKTHGRIIAKNAKGDIVGSYNRKVMNGTVFAKGEINELSTQKLADYKKKAGEEASAADKTGNTKKANKRFSGIMKATRKQFDNDLKEAYQVGRSVKIKHDSGKEMSGKIKGVHGSVVEISHRNGKVGFYHNHKLELLNELDPVEVKESLTYADIIRGRNQALPAEETNDGTAETIKPVEVEKEKKEGHSLNPSNDTHRKQLINHLRGH